MTIVYFTDGTGHVSSAWRRLYGAALVRLVWVASFRRIAHVCIADGHVVLDPKPGGRNVYWNITQYNALYPGIRAAVLLPEIHVDIEDVPRTPHPLGRMFVRWLSAGIADCDDCVTVTAGLLRTAGLAVPRRLTTPAGLLRWLARQETTPCRVWRFTRRSKICRPSFLRL
jgi:hypothetical protein